MGKGYIKVNKFLSTTKDGYPLGAGKMEAINNQKVEGEILFHDLVDWWLTSFTEDERKYIDDRYQPMGRPPHTLTQGKYLKREGETLDTGIFLNGLSTWFRNKTDVSVLQRVEEKIDGLGVSRPLVGVGYVRGRHYVTYVKDVKKIKSAGKLEEAEKLLLVLVDATEQVDNVEKQGVAPWYYEELAKIYRKNKDYLKEVSILKRFSKQRHGKGVAPKKLLGRLDKVKALLEKEK